MAKDDFTRLQNYIKRLASSAEEVRELISKLVLIDWNEVYPTKQKTVVVTGKVDAEPLLNVIADTHQAMGLSTAPEEATISNVLPTDAEISIGIIQGYGELTIATTTDQFTKEVMAQSTRKPRRSKPMKPKQPAPKYWEVKQRQLEAKEARLAKSPRVKELQAMPYAEYLKTDEWQKTRRRALASAGVKCQMCSATDKPLNIHHNSYERLGYERPSDVICLCEPCHAKHHDKLPKTLQ